MKLTRSILAVVLLLFVGATVGTLIAQEVTRPETQVAEIDASELPDETSSPAAGVTSTGGQDAVFKESAGMDATKPSDIGASDDVDTTDGSGEHPALSIPATDVPCVIEAVYFHNTNRCVTCLKIEGDAKAVVEEVYAEELASGKLRWSTIDMERNRSYISQYNLVSPSLVLLRKSGDDVVDWITLEETWSLVHSETKFSAYIIDGFQAFLEACP